jgi:hypothetical protein
MTLISVDVNHKCKVSFGDPLLCLTGIERLSSDQCSENNTVLFQIYNAEVIRQEEDFPLLNNDKSGNP